MKYHYHPHTDTNGELTGATVVVDNETGGYSVYGDPKSYEESWGEPPTECNYSSSWCPPLPQREE